VSILSGTLLHAAQAEPLVLESKIPLADVKGRIDHLAVDAARQRLYVAELGNNSVGVRRSSREALLSPGLPSLLCRAARRVWF
jgi:hypothetical protein